MSWALIGYFPKRRATRASWVSPWPDYPEVGFPCSEPVEEICSVSKCIAQGPEGWRDQGKHNFYDMYDTPGLAWSVVPAEVRSEFELFAYRLLLVEFDDAREEPMGGMARPDRRGNAPFIRQAGVGCGRGRKALQLWLLAAVMQCGLP